MNVWASMLDKFEKDENMYLLVAEEHGNVVSSVQMAIIESLTQSVTAIQGTSPRGRDSDRGRVDGHKNQECFDRQPL